MSASYTGQRTRVATVDSPQRESAMASLRARAERVLDTIKAPLASMSLTDKINMFFQMRFDMFMSRYGTMVRFGGRQEQARRKRQIQHGFIRATRDDS